MSFCFSMFPLKHSYEKAVGVFLVQAVTQVFDCLTAGQTIMWKKVWSYPILHKTVKPEAHRQSNREVLPIGDLGKASKCAEENQSSQGTWGRYNSYRPAWGVTLLESDAPPPCGSWLSGLPWAGSSTASISHSDIRAPGAGWRVTTFRMAWGKLREWGAWTKMAGLRPSPLSPGEVTHCWPECDQRQPLFLLNKPSKILNYQDKMSPPGMQIWKI